MAETTATSPARRLSWIYPDRGTAWQRRAEDEAVWEPYRKVAADLGLEMTLNKPEEIAVDTTDATHPLLVNAGHPPPLLVHADRTTEFLDADADLPLGLGQQYTHHSFAWRAGDRLLLYTDGLSEARDDRGAFFDLRELGPVIAGGPLEACLDGVLERVRAHARGELNDDVAVLLLEHTPTGPDFQPLTGEHDWRTSLPR